MSMVLAVGLSLIGCGDDENAAPTPTPAATSTALGTATPTPTVTPVIPETATFQLQDGSTISFTPATPGPGSISPEPLGGTFHLVFQPCPPLSPPPTPCEPDAFYAFAITNLDFYNPDLTVTGNAGNLIGHPVPGKGQVSMQADVTINGVPVSLTGTAPLMTVAFSCGTITGLEISGNGYTIVIFATLESSP
jgi:hypothetical protein